LDYGHPIVRPFRDRVAAGLLHVSINQYVQLQPKAGQLLAETVLAFNNGDPALVVDQLGLGRVAVMAIPCSLASRMSSGSPWSSFPVSPSFLPIVRETVDYLVGDRWQQQQNLLVGQPATCNVTSSSSLAGLEIRLPSGSKIKLQPPSADEGQVAFKDTSTSGVYSVIEGGEEYARLAVNLDTRESDLSTIDTADLPKAFTTRPAFATADTPILGAYQSFARTLLGGALLLLLAETSLAWLMGRGWE